MASRRPAAYSRREFAVKLKIYASKRWLCTRVVSCRCLQNRLAARAITVLTGARQTGKTTLVRDLLPAPAGMAPVYLSLDDPDERLRLEPPIPFAGSITASASSFSTRCRSSPACSMSSSCWPTAARAAASSCSAPRRSSCSSRSARPSPVAPPCSSCGRSAWSSGSRRRWPRPAVSTSSGGTARPPFAPGLIDVVKPLPEHRLGRRPACFGPALILQQVDRLASGIWRGKTTSFGPIPAHDFYSPKRDRLSDTC
jgi:hypothetical protein